MDNVIDYVSSPSTWISFIVFVFSLGVIYANLKGKINRLEEDVNLIKTDNNQLKVSLAEINTKLAEIQTSLKYVEKGLSNNK